MLVTSGYDEVQVQVLDEVSSTFDVAWAHQDSLTAGKRILVCAELQNAGRGRLDRSWVSPKGAGIALTLLTDLSNSHSQIAVGVAVVNALRSHGVPANLKWPNDILLGEQKLGGVLLQQRSGRLAIGIGLNVSLNQDELPRADATSLALAGFETDRAILTCDIVAAALRALASDSAKLLMQYRDYCDTIGRAVRITGVGGELLEGIARDVDELSNLVVEVAGEVHQVSVGDVEHLRVKP